MICAEISLGVSKYLNLSRSNRPENGTPPENSRTMAESTDVGAPKDFSMPVFENVQVLQSRT